MNETTLQAVYPPPSSEPAAPQPPEAGASAAVAMGGAGTPLPTLTEQMAARFHARGVSPDGLAAIGLVLSCCSSFVLFMDHPGMAAIVGFVALVLAELSIRPAPQMPLARTLRPQVLRPLTHLLMLTGLLAGVANHHAPIVALSALLLLVISAWIPQLDAQARFRGTSVLGKLWGAADRLGVVLLGALTGRLTAGIVIASLMGAFEAWRLVDRMLSPTGLAWSDQWLVDRRLLGPDYSVSPLARWGVLGGAALALFLLPASTAWRF